MTKSWPKTKKNHRLVGYEDQQCDQNYDNEHTHEQCSVNMIMIISMTMTINVIMTQKKIYSQKSKINKDQDNDFNQLRTKIMP